MAEPEAGFLGRWARRKTDVLQGKPLTEPAIVPPVVRPPVAGGLVAADQSRQTPQDQDVSASPHPDVAEPPQLSLDDVARLTQDSDFKPFMAQNVGPEVRNAAMKKLFADPHFNVMDGLDIYIDDYSQSDPIPESMLKQMTSSKFLKLFDDEEQEDSKPHEQQVSVTAEVVPDNPLTTAQLPGPADTASPDVPTAMITPLASTDHSSHPDGLIPAAASQEHHADPDLRLQPNDATPARKAGVGAQ